jgi:hypothetical protein
VQCDTRENNVVSAASMRRLQQHGATQDTSRAARALFVEPSRYYRTQLAQSRELVMAGFFATLAVSPPKPFPRTPESSARQCHFFRAPPLLRSPDGPCILRLYCGLLVVSPTL